jgi:DNA-binding response OmpR family regulator
MAPPETSIAVKVLSVGFHPDDHIALSEALRGQEPPHCANCRFEVAATDSVEGALRVLKNDRIPIVLSECELGKDTWKTLLARLEQLQDPPFLIVGSRSADEFLWAEALNLGAYDVLAKPFRASEVVRTLGLAWLRWSKKQGRRPGTGRMTAAVPSHDAARI